MRDRGWASLDLIGAAIRRLNRQWLALPRTARRRWWSGLAIGIVVTAAFDVLLVLAVRSLEASGGLAWEAAAMHRVEALPISFSVGMWLEGPGNGFVLWALVLFAAGVAAWYHRPLLSVTFLTGQTLVYGHVALCWSIWDRPRPRIVLDGLADPGGVFYAFPSGHMIQTVVPLGLLTWLWLDHAEHRSERFFAILCFVAVVIVVGIGRLRVGAHWPSDLIGGVLVGGAWLIAIIATLAAAESAAQHYSDNIDLPEDVGFQASEETITDTATAVSTAPRSDRS